MGSISPFAWPLPGATIQTTSSILKSLAASEKERLSLGEVVKAARSRAHGFGILLFALPETIPVPLPSASIVLAIPVILIAAHLAAFGEGPGLPKRLLRQTIPVSLIRKVSTYVGPVFEKMEHLSRPRLLVITKRERLLGVLCLLLGIVLAAPIPFGNLAPAIGIAVIAFGMLQHDGVLILIGIALALALGVVFYLAAEAVLPG